MASSRREGGYGKSRVSSIASMVNDSQLPEKAPTIENTVQVEILKGGFCGSVAFWSCLQDPREAIFPATSTSCLDSSVFSKERGLQFFDGKAVEKGDTVELRVVQETDQLVFLTVPSQRIPRHAALPRWHFDMVLDDRRNQAFEKAIRRGIEFKKSIGCELLTVLDAGAGSGLLSMMSARAGAGKVVGVEISPHLCDTGEEIVIMNGFGGVCKMINKDVRHVSSANRPNNNPPDLDGKAQILVMEVFDSGLIGEGALHIISAAYRSFLDEDAIILPAGATVYFQLIQVDRVSHVHGIDVSHINRFHWRPSYDGIDLRRGKHIWHALSDEAIAFDFNFYEHEKNMRPASLRVELRAKDQGIVNAVAFWFDLHLDEHCTLSTGPNAEQCTWQQAVQYVQERRVKSGDRVVVYASHDTRGIAFE
ncbi:unnamed protein product, partial [Ostreobium quekettii]|eukprot:evm.model.scf_588.4 EVM.evm.TU.scf_588.4   scf_588:57896-65127(+)